MTFKRKKQGLLCMAHCGVLPSETSSEARPQEVEFIPRRILADSVRFVIAKQKLDLNSAMPPFDPERPESRFKRALLALVGFLCGKNWAPVQKEDVSTAFPKNLAVP